MSTSAPPLRPQPGKRLPLAPLILVVAATGFAVSEWAQSGANPGAHPQRVATEPPVPDRSPTELAPPRAAWATGAAPATVGTATVASTGTPRAATSELVSRVAGEARAKIEGLRGYITSSCWARGAAGPPSLKVTFNVTFDAAGREIARGISEERRAPAGEFGRCLRKLQGTALAIAPPGANVGVSIPVVFP